jgi:hypothetical protein
MKKNFGPLRVASYLLVLFAFGHTSGAVIKVPHFGPASDAVVSQMQNVHIAAQGADCTWYGFYRGFGWYVTLFLLLAAFLAWWVGGMDARSRPALLPVAWGLALVNVANVPLTFLYFFPAPRVFQSVIAALLVLGCVLQSVKARETEA